MGLIDEPNGKLFLDKLHSKKAIAFVGAGASMELYGSWNDLLVYLGNAAKEKQMATDDEVEFWALQRRLRPQQVARMIRSNFAEDSEFHQVLEDYFGPRKSGTTGKCYTPLHKVISQLPFRGIVTTNYDPGLWHALLDFRNNVCTTPFATWDDKDIIQKWRSKDIFNKSECPILYLHGSCDNPSTIVLDSDKYRYVYEDRDFDVMFKSVWEQESLIIIGYGFSDTWLDRNLDEILARNPQYKHSRHIALIGQRREDEKHSASFRRMMFNMYRINVIFYKIETDTKGHSEDHSDLIRLVEEARQLVYGETPGLDRIISDTLQSRENIKSFLAKRTNKIEPIV